MGAISKLTDAVLFLFFLFVGITAPITDGMTILPPGIFPKFLVDLKSWYVEEFGDYLFAEKPHFFVGVTWLELLFQWPLALICLYGLLGSKSWLNTTCLMYGSSVLTSMAAIVAELTASGRAPDALMKVYLPFLAFSILVILRGLLSHPQKSSDSGKRTVMSRKKRA